MFHWLMFILLIVSTLFFLNLIGAQVIFSWTYNKNIARRSTQNAVRKCHVTKPQIKGNKT